MHFRFPRMDQKTLNIFIAEHSIAGSNEEGNGHILRCISLCLGEHMISKESLDGLNNLDDVLIVEHVVPAHPHRLVFGAGSPHQCVPDQDVLHKQKFLR